ncbi:MAG: DNA/RNA non-specific endonuclease [Pseudomonadota bacterium]
MPDPLTIASKTGYDPDFLGVNVPLPEFGPELVDFIVLRDQLRDGVFADYVNYTVATHAVLRTPVFSAMNIDQARLKSVDRTDNWRIDTRIGRDFQLNNDYYRSNPWDRGHLARRASAAWGDTARQAKHASDDTFFYSNASLQHANFNQDEWLALEDWVLMDTPDDTDRISSITGPIFGDTPRSITPQGRDTALIPSAFFKVVSYIRDGALEVRAFIMAQDAAAIRDRRGRRMFDNQRYQVSVTEIEEQTGLIFPQVLPELNPLFFNPNAEMAEKLHITSFPERIEVDDPAHIIAMDQMRDEVLVHGPAVFIVAAMVNPKGADREGEWVTIMNLSGEPVNLDGWSLSDTLRQPLALDGTLEPGMAMRLGPVTPLQLGNDGGTLCLYDADKCRIDRVRYRGEDVDEGLPVSFLDRSRPISPGLVSPCALQT